MASGTIQDPRWIFDAPLATVTDMDSLPVGVWYVSGTGLSHMPGTGAYFFLCMKYTTTHAVQVAFARNEDKIWLRRRLSGSWNAWKSVTLT